MNAKRDPPKPGRSNDFGTNNWIWKEKKSLNFY